VPGLTAEPKHSRGGKRADTAKPSLGQSLAAVERRDSSAVACFEAASGTIGPKFLDGFLKLGMSIAQSPKPELQSSSPWLLVMHCTYRPKVLSNLLNHRQIMVSGLRAIGRRPTAAREQNK